MSAKEQATLDIMADLEKSNKCFIAFHRELNPIMRKLVSQQIRQQQSINSFLAPSYSNSQLVAHCFFVHGEIEYSDYSKYYK